jgi:TMEM164 family
MWSGAILFTLYERWVLLPVSLLTWANLNHSLCGVHNDPFYEMFQLGKWYWFWADFYLTLACFVGFIANIVLVTGVVLIGQMIGLIRQDEIEYKKLN